MLFTLQNKVKTEWSPNFAYAIGLITSDGCLHRDKRHMSFSSKDIELIKKFKTALGLKNKPTKSARGGETTKKYYSVHFGDKIFYQFLNSIGLTVAKSKTIKSVFVPDEYFADFLRGLFDGDGTFYTFWDKRWPNSFGFKTAFASASLKFTKWLKEKLTNLYDTKGCLHKGAGVTNLEYVKGDTKKIYQAMYYRDDLLFFSKKYIKIKNALKKDEKFGLIFLQKQQKAAVAQLGRAEARRALCRGSESLPQHIKKGLS